MKGDWVRSRRRLSSCMAGSVTCRTSTSSRFSKWNTQWASNNQPSSKPSPSSNISTFSSNKALTSSPTSNPRTCNSKPNFLVSNPTFKTCTHPDNPPKTLKSPKYKNWKSKSPIANFTWRKMKKRLKCWKRKSKGWMWSLISWRRIRGCWWGRRKSWRGRWWTKVRFVNSWGGGWTLERRWRLSTRRSFKTMKRSRRNSMTKKLFILKPLPTYKWGSSPQPSTSKSSTFLCPKNNNKSTNFPKSQKSTRKCTKSNTKPSKCTSRRPNRSRKKKN